MAQTRTEMNKSAMKKMQRKPGSPKAGSVRPSHRTGTHALRMNKEEDTMSFALTECSVRGFGYPSMLRVHLHLHHARVTGQSPFLSSFSTGAGDPNSGPQMCVASASPSEPSPSPLFLNFCF